MRWLVAIAVIAASACGRSPKVRFFTLVPSIASARSSYSGPPIRVEAVQLPSSIDGPQMFRWVTAYEIEARDSERWSESLGYLIRQTLAQSLASRLPEGAMVYPDAPKPPGTRGLVVDVLTLTEMNGMLTLDVSWSLLGGDPVALVERRQQVFTADADGSAEGTSKALSRVTSDLADAITNALTTRA